MMRNQTLRSNILERFTTPLVAVGNAFIAASAWVMSYTGLPVEPAAVLAVLMVVDFVAGITCAIALGKPVTSHRMKVGLMSKCGVMTIPLVMALAAKGLGADFHWLINWSVSLFILSEAYSIVANIYTARTGNQVPEWDAVSIIMSKIRSMLEGFDKRA